LSDEIHKTFNTPEIGPIFNEWVSFLTFFSEWKTHRGIGALSITLIDEIDKCDELSFFIQTLVEECTIGLLLIFSDDPDEEQELPSKYDKKSAHEAEKSY
tara:strand:+ start:131 stop:430 length:300 start_codon:yes stop_codon:yes gene_type:complete